MTRTKPHLNVGTIGHNHVGIATLARAVAAGMTQMQQPTGPIDIPGLKSGWDPTKVTLSSNKPYHPPPKGRAAFKKFM
jgi:hypothetical protein